MPVKLSSSDCIMASTCSHHADRSACSGSSLAARGIIWASSDLQACDDRKDTEVWRVLSGGRLVVLWALVLLLMLVERDYVAATAYAALLAVFTASLIAAPLCRSFLWAYWSQYMVALVAS